ncbi:MAG: transglycosylase SLT domain-containing protein, partial [Enterovibrio sp.]
DQAKRILDDMIVGAKKAGATNKARLIGETREQLISHLDAAAPTYKEARKAFESASEGLNALEKTKFKMLMDIDPTDTQKIGTLFRYEPEQIAELRKSFVKADELEAFEAGIRGYLQRGLESKREGFDLASQFTTPVMKKKLEAALGHKAENVVKALDIEQKIAAGKREYLGGSTTRSQTTAEAELAGVAGTAQEITRKEGWGQKALGLLSQALINKPEAEFYQDLANIYFSPRAGEFLAELSPLVKALKASKAAGEMTGAIAQRVAQKGAGRTGVGTSSTKGPSKSALAVGGAGLSAGMPEIEQLLAEINSSVNGPAASQETARPKTPPSKQNISAIISAKPAIIQAMVQAESSGNPNAIGPKTKSGRAQGLMQLIPSTAKALGVTDSLDPQQNIDAGEKYFDQMLKKFGSQELALAAYNWGPGNLSKAIDRLEAKKQKPTWSNLLRYTSVPEETEEYVAAVLGNLKRG